MIYEGEESNKKEILLLGSGGHCMSSIDVIELTNAYCIVGIIDNEKSIGDKVLGYPVIGSDDDLEKLFLEYQYAFIAVGQIESPRIRIQLFEVLKKIGYSLPTIISPLAYVSKYAEVAEGTIIMHHALVNVNAKIGKNCIINTKALVEHDVVVEDYCHISTGAILNGGVLVKEGTFYGSNTTSKESVEIEGFIKAGKVAI